MIDDTVEITEDSIVNILRDEQVPQNKIKGIAKLIFPSVQLMSKLKEDLKKTISFLFMDMEEEIDSLEDDEPISNEPSSMKFDSEALLAILKNCDLNDFINFVNGPLKELTESRKNPKQSALRALRQKLKEKDEQVNLARENKDFEMLQRIFEEREEINKEFFKIEAKGPHHTRKLKFTFDDGETYFEWGGRGMKPKAFIEALEKKGFTRHAKISDLAAYLVG